jgi:hypothetical protein
MPKKPNAPRPGAAPSARRAPAAKKAAAVKRPAAKRAAPPAKPAAPARDTKPAAKAAPPAAKPAKPKLVRDSFTIPKAEYAVIDELKRRAAQFAHAAKKSELLRAGIKALAQMNDRDFMAAVQSVPSIKTGRPKAKRPAEAAQPG